MTDLDTPWPLEPTPETFKTAAHAVAEHLGAYLEALPTLPVTQPEGDPADLGLGITDPGAPFADVLATVFDDVLPPGYQPAGPGYLAYIPGGGIVSSGLAAFVAAVTNKYVGIWAASPGFVQLELEVVRWFCTLVGLDPDVGGGFLTTGGSLANFSAVVAARQDRLPPNFLKGTVYASNQAHHCVAKAALLAGFPRENLRRVPVDAGYRMDVGALEAMLEEDRAAGFQPFMLVANAGTTNTGAVDPMLALADVAEREGLWFHVDAAYGGFFLLTEQGRHAMAGMERADSVALDPHKGLFLPYGTGGLIVRNRRTLSASHSVDADYLTDMVGEDDRRVDLSEISPELSRDNRGIRVWLPLKVHGVAAFREALEEKLTLAQKAWKGVLAIPHIEPLAAPQLSVCAWRYVPSGGGAPATIDALNAELMKRVTARGRVMLTGTTLGDVFACRIAVLCVRTHAQAIEAALDDIGAVVEELEQESREA